MRDHHNKKLLFFNTKFGLGAGGLHL
jgi:hypothetical protein